MYEIGAKRKIFHRKMSFTAIQMVVNLHLKADWFRKGEWSWIWHHYSNISYWLLVAHLFFLWMPTLKVYFGCSLPKQKLKKMMTLTLNWG